VLTPVCGTPLYDQHLRAGRLLLERDWPHYNGYNVAFRPAKMSPERLLTSHRAMWRRAFSPALVAERLARGGRTLRPGAMMLSAAMNGFYGVKRLTGNVPKTAARENEGLIAHPQAELKAPGLVRARTAYPQYGP
jgi:hypothetical protein